MSRTLNITVALVLTVGVAGIAQADAKHHGAPPSSNAVTPVDGQTTAPVWGPMGQGGMMGGGHHEMMQGMMQMMMQMHGGTMGADPGMMGAMGGMGMMDHDIVGLMHRPMIGGANADANGDGTVSPEEAHGQLQALHADADADGDGTLSLTEFEALHARMIHGMMVDRFQHLDEDGDGKVTPGEMTAPADRMEMLPLRPGMMDSGFGVPNN